MKIHLNSLSLSFALIASLSSLSLQAVAQSYLWQPNDISIGFPLPSTESSKDLIALTNKTPMGSIELLPREVFNMLGDDATDLPFLYEAPGREKAYDYIKIVSVRVDPCFDALDAKKATSCTRMIRLVGQTFMPASDTSEEWSGLSDAAIHLFYTLTDDEFVDFLTGLKAIRPAGTSGPLGVHPIMIEEGLTGGFASKFKKLLLKYTNTKHLTRFTFMATGRNGTNWFWSKLDKDANGKFIVNTIPPQNQTINDDFTQESKSNAIDETLSQGEYFPIAFRSNNTIANMSDQELKSGIDLLLRNENPAMTTTAMVNCAACHVSNVTLRYALSRKNIWTVPQSPSAFQNPIAQAMTEIVPTAIDRKDMHAFSYRERDFKVAPRTVNETMASLDFLNGKEFVKGLSKKAQTKYLKTKISPHAKQIK